MDFVVVVEKDGAGGAHPKHDITISYLRSTWEPQ